GEEHRIGPSHRLECRGKQHDVRRKSPDKSRRKVLFFVGAAMNSANLQGSTPYRFGRLAVWFTAGQSDKRDVPSITRPSAPEQYRILAHRAKIRRQPIT